MSLEFHVYSGRVGAGGMGDYEFADKELASNSLRVQEARRAIRRTITYKGRVDITEDHSAVKSAQDAEILFQHVLREIDPRASNRVQPTGYRDGALVFDYTIGFDRGDKEDIIKQLLQTPVELVRTFKTFGEAGYDESKALQLELEKRIKQE